MAKVRVLKYMFTFNSFAITVFYGILWFISLNTICLDLTDQIFKMDIELSENVIQRENDNKESEVFNKNKCRWMEWRSFFFFFFFFFLILSGLISMGKYYLFIVLMLQ